MSNKKFDLDAYKKTLNVADTPLKPDSFVVLDECIQSVIGMPGIALGHITQVFGKSDTGKTSILFHTAAQAQAQGILPILLVTEGKVDWGRAKLMGFDKNNAIVNDNLEFLENAFDFIDKVTSDVIMGELPQDVIILWDSVGNTLSKDEVEVKADGTYEKKSTMMKAAKVISERMRVISKKINDTRKISSPRTVGLMILNQAYTQPPAFPGGPSTLVPYGGVSIWYRSTLVLKTSKVKKLKATKNGHDMGFGIVSKITVDKNHLTNVTNEGEFVIVANGIIPNEPQAIKDHKENNKQFWGEEFVMVEEKDA